jgi:putative PIN family toxin of toxin-antitoxin system
VRTVLDANVPVSAILFPRSVPGQVLTRARELGVLLTTNELVTELHDVLVRPKFARYTTRALRDEFLATYIVEAEFVLITEAIAVCRDPIDDRILSKLLSMAEQRVLSVAIRICLC